MRTAIAESVATELRWREVPPEVGDAGKIHIVRHYVKYVRGFHHPDDVTAITREAFEIMFRRELAAMAACRRPPRRRRRTRPPQAIQLAFEFAA